MKEDFDPRWQVALLFSVDCELMTFARSSNK